MSRLFLLFLACLFASCFASSFSCKSSDLAAGTTYDLTPLMASSYYLVQDSADYAFRDYIYVFNICSDVATTPVNPWTGKALTTCAGVTAAYQFSNISSYCNILGQTSNYTWSLYDTTRKASGVVLTYENGDECSLPTGKKKRSFGINFLCGPTKTNIPSSRVIEDTFAKCEYEVTFTTAFACPKECPISNGIVCGGHGVCDYDHDLAISKCFCNNGYQGPACTLPSGPATSVPSSTDVTTILQVFVFILLAVVIVLGVVLYIKMRSLKPDDTAYKSLDVMKSEIDHHLQISSQE